MTCTPEKLVQGNGPKDKQVLTSNKGVGIEDIQKEDEMKLKVGDRVIVDAGKKTYRVNEVGYFDREGEIHLVPFSGTYWIDAKRLTPSRVPRKQIRRSLKEIRSDLRQFAAEVCSRDRIQGEQADRIADKVAELVEQI